MNGKRTAVRVAIVVGGAVAAVVVWALAKIAGGIQVSLGGGAATDMPWWQVIAASLVGGLAGWALLAILEARIGSRARKIWTIVAVIVVVVSLAGPFGTPGIALGDRFWLAAIHIVLGLVVIPAMGRTSRASEDSRAVSR